ncbi:YgdI/YgdR family lipoprotein [Streptomyces beigongshangae]|uniref:YgdI/YgdR family lipoprotein n=1 Tax=Streptomyces beigongshangae TaxID=2841597 RepID=UPI001C851AAF|nr:YgdI/YgdR family lipoprotein [Streptomyces sp. REN17]
MRRLRGFGAVVAAGTVALVLAGCGTPTDTSEIVTFTDEHGRVCTAAVIVDKEQNEGDDYEVSSLDCEYPPEGRTPGPTRYSPLPDRDAK